MGYIHIMYQAYSINIGIILEVHENILISELELFEKQAAGVPGSLKCFLAPLLLRKQ